jgi:F-type H+-transporting ATPase subunit alpha
MDVEKQVLGIWAATNGFVDDVPVEDVRRFELSLLKFVENSHPGVLAAIAEKKTLTDDIKGELKQVLEDFKDVWQSGDGPEFAPATTTRQTSTMATA